MSLELLYFHTQKKKIAVCKLCFLFQLSYGPKMELQSLHLSQTFPQQALNRLPKFKQEKVTLKFDR